MTKTAKTYFAKTTTSGWFLKLDENGAVADGKHRKPKDGEFEIYDTVRLAQDAFAADQYNGTTPKTTDKVKAAGEAADQVRESVAARNAEKMDVPTTVAPTGKILVGKTIEIKCQHKGCKETRVIKPQDAFQVKYCVEHQKVNRREAQKAKRRAKAAERKAAEAKKAKA